MLNEEKRVDTDFRYFKCTVLMGFFGRVNTIFYREINVTGTQVDCRFFFFVTILGIMQSIMPVETKFSLCSHK